MKLFLLLTAFAAIPLALPACALAQERGAWRAASTTARAITGDVVLSADKLGVNFYAFTIANIRALTPAETTATFGGEATGNGTLYRLNVPANRKFLHGNTLCGSDDTQWMAAYAAGKTLQLAFFSGSAMPVFVPDAIANSASLCGTYGYSR